MSLDFKKIILPLFFLGFGLGLSLQVQAQINAPEFLCVQNDTLRWNLPVNTCGAFNGYVIYRRQNLTGPYSQLTNITDPTQGAFFHDGAGNQTWYYYLESDLDCPGQPVFQSDTLDNRIPDPGPIQLVTVEDDSTVRVDWMPSPSPEVTGYIVSRQNALGTTILDTVYGALTYTDATPKPNEQSETYFVVALDPCGNVSLVPDPHQTILLEIVSVDSCSQEVQLRWSEYINWPEGVARYEIWASETSPASQTPGPYLQVGAVEGTVTEFIFPTADDGRRFCFKIQAVAQNTEDISFSNETCVDIGIIQSVRDLVITDLEVAPDLVAVIWILQPDIDMANATLFRSENGTDFSPIADVIATDQFYLDMTTLGNSQQLSYRIEAVDLCGNEITSNIASTIHLSGESKNGDQNVLTWTPYFNEAGRLNNYEFYRIAGTDETFVGTHAQGEEVHIDPIDLSDPTQTAICYYVVANANIDLSVQVVNTKVFSNRVCLEQSAQLFVPNAFVPDGVNRIFKPVLQFGDSQEYVMTIYDRFGGVLFESQDVETGWDGRKNGRPLPQGMYVYLIKMTQGGGQTIEKKGTVLLLR